MLHEFNNLTAHCATIMQNIIIDYAKEPCFNICLNINLHKPAINLMQMRCKCGLLLTKP